MTAPPSRPSDRAGARHFDPLTRVQFLPGVGPMRAQAFERLGVTTLEQLMRHYPREWLDASTFVAIKNLTPGKAESAAGSSLRQVIELQQGLTTEMCREVVKVLKEAKLKKVQSAIQGDAVRISSASKDDLQGAMQLLRGHDFGVELKFENFRTN